MEPDSDQKSRVQRRFSRLFFPRIYFALYKLNFRYFLKIIYFFSEIFINFVNKTTNQILKCDLLKRDFYFTKGYHKINFVKKMKFSEKVEAQNFRKIRIFFRKPLKSKTLFYLIVPRDVN